MADIYAFAFHHTIGFTIIMILIFLGICSLFSLKKFIAWKRESKVNEAPTFKVDDIVSYSLLIGETFKVEKVEKYDGKVFYTIRNVYGNKESYRNIREEFLHHFAIIPVEVNTTRSVDVQTIMSYFSKHKTCPKCGAEFCDDNIQECIKRKTVFCSYCDSNFVEDIDKEAEEKKIEKSRAVSNNSTRWIAKNKVCPCCGAAFDTRAISLASNRDRVICPNCSAIVRDFTYKK